MNMTPYIIICASNVHGCDELNSLRDRTSQVISTVSATMSQANALPSAVEILSTPSRSFCIAPRSGAAEVVVVCHLEVDDGVVLPAGRALGEGLLRLEDLLEHRVLVRALLDHLVPDLELA